MQLNKILVVMSLAAGVLPTHAHAQSLTDRIVKQGHMVCYSRDDMIDALEAVQDENYTLAMKFIQQGKCIMLERDRKFKVADFNPSDSIQAVIFPSGKWGRVPTRSIK